MRYFGSLSRAFSKPATLWGLFMLVLAIAAGGLTVLSRQALRLNDEQWRSQQSVQLEQNVRVALWRLDSRLGPFIATLHDPAIGSFVNSEPDRFVIERFRMEQDKNASEKRFIFAPMLKEDGTPALRPNWSRMTKTISVDAVVAAVETLLPIGREVPGQSLVQSYAVQIPASNSFSERELSSRNAVVQQRVALNTTYGGTKGKVTNPATENEAADQPAKLMSVWIDDQLLVVRSSRTDAAELNGVWIDWPALRQSLADEVNDLVPDVSFLPVKQSEQIDPSRTLAAIPAMIVPPMRGGLARGWSPTRTSLLLAWFALAASALLAAVALSRLIALSERRASFVSAVTHELRTPLTTFRLYSDLLARDMVSDPSDRKEYLQTLRREADRLTNLVDNVLRYSKLQRTSKHAALETILLSQWIERITPRLAARLDAADMQLDVTVENDGRWSTDPPAMEQVLFNLIDNAAKYAQSATDRRVHLHARIEQSMVVMTVIDHGSGVPASFRSTIFRPFAKSAERAAETAAGVGLGLALAKQTAIALGGKLAYDEAEDGGASFRLQIPRGNAQ